LQSLKDVLKSRILTQKPSTSLDVPWLHVPVRVEVSYCYPTCSDSWTCVHC
jgi:hypothetical protein